MIMILMIIVCRAWFEICVQSALVHQICGLVDLFTQSVSMPLAHKICAPIHPKSVSKGRWCTKLCPKALWFTKSVATCCPNCTNTGPTPLALSHTWVKATCCFLSPHLHQTFVTTHFGPNRCKRLWLTHRCPMGPKATPVQEPHLTPHSLTHSLTHSPTHSPTHLLTPSPHLTSPDLC